MKHFKTYRSPLFVVFGLILGLMDIFSPLPLSWLFLSLQAIAGLSTFIGVILGVCDLNLLQKEIDANTHARNHPDDYHHGVLARLLQSMQPPKEPRG